MLLHGRLLHLLLLSLMFLLSHSDPLFFLFFQCCEMSLDDLLLFHGIINDARDLVSDLLDNLPVLLVHSLVKLNHFLSQILDPLDYPLQPFVKLNLGVFVAKSKLLPHEINTYA